MCDLVVGVADDGDKEAVVRVDGHADVDLGIAANHRLVPVAVERRHFLERSRHRLDHKVVDRQPGKERGRKKERNKKAYLMSFCELRSWRTRSSSSMTTSTER
jgi:hypothetical protein